MKNLLVCLVFLVSISTNAIGDFYPIKPRPLRSLINEAEVIIIGQVIESNPSNQENSWTTDVATIAVKEVLQGDEENESIKVYYTPNMICPAPARYPKGSIVLAFLDKHEDNYITHALSYGSKVLSEEELDLYKSRIIEMFEINKEKDKSKKRIKVTDWLVKCAKHRATRWEGTYELSPKSDFMSFYDRNRNKNPYILNSNQIKELRDVLFNIEDIDSRDLGLVDIAMESDSDVEMRNFLVDQLKRENVGIWECEFVMSRINFIEKKGELARILTELEEGYNLDDFDAEQERRKKLIKKFIESL